MSERSDATTATPSGTVVRVVRLLSFMAQNQETTIRDLSEALSLAPSTCHRLLELLAAEGMIAHDKARSTYRIGAEFYRIAAQVQNRDDVCTNARRFLREVVEACDETCVLSLYLPVSRQMIFAERADSSRLLRYQLPMNVPLSALWGASSRSFLAFLPAAEVELIRAKESVSPASGEPVPERAALERELEEIRRRGFAVSRGQKIAGAVGISAPVFRAEGQVLGSLGITVPEIRVSPVDLERLGQLVTTKAQALSETLGAEPSPVSKP